MKNSNENDFQPEARPTQNDPAGELLKQRYHDSLRQLEDHEALFADRLIVRQNEARKVFEFQKEDLEALDQEMLAEKSNLKERVHIAKQNVDAAHRAAAEQCSVIGVRYAPGKTTEEDVLQVPSVHEAEAAQKLGLPFGLGMREPLFIRIAKIVSMIACWMMSTVSLGLMFRILNPKNPFSNPATVVIALVIGALATFAIVVVMDRMWRAIGAKVGSARPSSEVMPQVAVAGLITLAMVLGMALLDQMAILHITAAKAMLNKAFQIHPGHALLIGLVLSGAYVLSSAFSAFIFGYSEEAQRLVRGLVESDRDQKQAEAKATIPIQAALDALGQVEVAQTRLAALEEELKKLDESHRKDRAAIVASFPVVPTDFTEEEKRTMHELRQRHDAAKANHQAWEASRA